MVHLPQSELSIQSSAADNKGDKHLLIMALMMQFWLCFMGRYFWLRYNSLELFNLLNNDMYYHTYNAHM